MTNKRNLELVHRMYEALNAHDVEAHDEFWTEDMIWHGPPGWGDLHGRDTFKYQLLKPFYESFPDYHAINVIEMTDGDMVAATGYFTGTHLGDWFGIAPTGRTVVGWFSDFWRVVDGKLSENWVMIDMVGIAKQLGVDLMPTGNDN